MPPPHLVARSQRRSGRNRSPSAFAEASPVPLNRTRRVDLGRALAPRLRSAGLTDRLGAFLAPDRRRNLRGPRPRRRSCAHRPGGGLAGGTADRSGAARTGHRRPIGERVHRLARSLPGDPGRARGRSMERPTVEPSAHGRGVRARRRSGARRRRPRRRIPGLVGLRRRSAACRPDRGDRPA